MFTRQLISWRAGILLLILVFGPAGPANARIPARLPKQSTISYQEAPLLAARVAAGLLPPVTDRLPDSPVVITPVASIGEYGGTWHTASWYSEMGNALLKMYDPPIRWKADYSGYEPGLAQSYEWSADGLTFTLHLRPGLKWSDSAPYTSEDWRFWWEDLALNGSYPSVSASAWLRKSDNSPVDMHFPDTYTVVWVSDKPQWVTPFFMAQGFWEFSNQMMKPAHYLKQFHPDYNPTATYADLEAADQWWQNPDFPTVFAWHCSKVDSSGAYPTTTFERNPYYWKVDPQGKQLPYIDYLKVEVTDEMLPRAATGHYDAVFRGIGGPLEIPYLQANAALYGYHLQADWMNGAGAWPGYMVNQDYVAGGGNYPDDTPEHAAEIRAFFRDARFRKALSTGFDRLAVIQQAWGGVGVPQQATVSPQSQHFSSPQGQLVYQTWATSDAALDLTQANQWLDQLGMVDADFDGWRDLPSGRLFTLIIDFNDWGGSYAVQAQAAAEMERQWEANLDILVSLNDLQGNPTIDNRVSQGHYMVRAVHVAEMDLWTYPDWLFPIYNRYIFPLEGLWYQSGGAQGMAPEPGSPAARLQALYEQGLAEADFAARHEIIWDAIQIHIDEGPFVIGVSGDQPAPVLIKNNFHNVPEYGVIGPWAPASPGNMHPEQFWIERTMLFLPLLIK